MGLVVGDGAGIFCAGFTAEQCARIFRPTNVIAYASRIPDPDLVSGTADADARANADPDAQPGDRGVDPDADSNGLSSNTRSVTGRTGMRVARAGANQHGDPALRDADAR
jgi:hypothetical protein